MKTQKIPVLLTSSVVAHDTGVALTDTCQRTSLALESVKEWLKIAPDLQIVLCDGSGFDFSEPIKEHFAHAAVECLYFDNDQKMVRQFGRGYGEGEIVRYALSHSQFISKAGCFAKCTSKLWVENFIQCLTGWNGQFLFKGVFSNVFSLTKKTKMDYIDTRFYIASNMAYKTYFENAHLQIKKDQGYGLEQCFFEVFQKNNMKKNLFNIPPVICGVGGGTGVSYKNSLKRRLKEKLRSSLVRRNKNYFSLFSEISTRNS